MASGKRTSDSLLVGDADTPFPRGGGAEANPLDIKRARLEATRDVYDETRKANRSKRRKHALKPEKQQRSVKIEPFSFSTLRIGTLVLGQVMNVLDDCLTLSLPNNLIGYASLEDDEVSAVEGQYLRTIVTGLGEAPQRRLELSVDPELVNQTIGDDDWLPGMMAQAKVASVEERGCVLDLGAGRSGFLPEKLNDGQLILATIRNAESRVVQLTTDHSELLTVHEQSSLVPGTLVSYQPVSEVATGATVTVFGHIEATADFVHSRRWDPIEGRSSRVLWSHPSEIGSARPLGLSFLPHILKLQALAPPIESGLKARAKVNFASIMGLIAEVKGAEGFVHISQLSDGHVDNLNRFKPGSTHDARVLNWCAMDNLLQLTFQQSALDSPYVAYEEVRVGDVVTATVDRLLESGLVVSLGRVVGIVPGQHLSDSASGKRFKQGQHVTARVLDVDKDKKRCRVTLKHSLMDCEAVIDYPPENTKVVGVLSQFKPRGAVCEFFNGLRGFLPLNLMGESPPSKPEELFRLGQTVSLFVVQSLRDQRRLILSVRPGHKGNTMPGSTVDATVVAKSKDGVTVDLDGESGFVPLSHLDDSNEKAIKRLKKLSPGEVIRVLVFGRRKVADATAKPSMLMQPIPQTLTDLQIGAEYAGFIVNVTSLGLFISLGRLVGLMPITGDDYEIGQSITAQVASIDLDKERFTLQISSEVDAVVTKVLDTQLNTKVGDQQGRVDVSLLFKSWNDIEDPEKPLQQFERGQALHARILGLHDARNHRFLPISHRNSAHTVYELAVVPPQTLEIGKQAMAFVNNITSEGIWAHLTPTSRARLWPVDLAGKEVHVGQALQVTVKSTDPLIVTCVDPPTVAEVTHINTTSLSLRLPGRQHAKIHGLEALTNPQRPLRKEFKVNELIPWPPKNAAVENVTAGEVVKGFVSNVAEHGVFVSLGPKLVGRVQIAQLSDAYLKDWRKLVKEGDAVTAKVLKVENGRIELSLKQSVVTGRKPVEQLAVGQFETGTIRRVEPFGVLVMLPQGVTGLCHRTEIADRPIENLSKVFTAGESVRVKVLAIDTEKGRVSLGMKASYLNEAESVSELEPESESESELGSEGSDSQEEDESDSLIRAKGGTESAGSSRRSSIEISEELSLSNGEESHSSSENEESEDDGPVAGLSAGWGDAFENPLGSSQSESESDDDDDDEPRRKRRHKPEFVKDKTAELQTQIPQSTKDFERLLVANPGSSVIWMQYMAFMLQLGEIDDARKLAERALGSIAASDEKERLNVWVAWLNLEANFGTAESVSGVFSEATRQMDSLTMYLKLSDVWSKAGNDTEARSTLQAACRKFGSDNLTVWTTLALFYFNHAQPDQARQLLDAALKRLPEQLHKQVIIQAARNEYTLGDAERGRTLFEGLVAAFPKKIDIWQVYIDQESKLVNSDRVTALMERVLARKLTMKQAKLFFKKWLQFESDHGDGQGEEYVKAKAARYVEMHQKET